MKFHSLRYKILAVIFFVALVCSLLLSFVPLQLICTPLQECNAVQTSPYAKTLGIDNSYYGILIFAMMLSVILVYIKKPSRGKKLLISAGIFTGTLIALYFLYLQMFVIHAYCKYCLVVDIGMVVSFIILNIPGKDHLEKNLEIPIEPKKASSQ